MEARTSYKGNESIKKTGVAYQYTQEETEEFIKCMKDPIYFAENYIHIANVDGGLVPIQLYDYQKKFLSHINENRHSICLASRQVGKCVGGDTEVNIWIEGEEQIISMKDLFNKIEAMVS